MIVRSFPDKSFYLSGTVLRWSIFSTCRDV